MFIWLFPVRPDQQELIPINSVGIKRIKKPFKILNRKTQNIKQNVCSYLKYFDVILLSWWKLLTISSVKKHEHFYSFIENCSYLFTPSGRLKLKSVINFNSIPIELLGIETRTLLRFCLIMFVFWTILKTRTIMPKCELLFGIT